MTANLAGPLSEVRILSLAEQLPGPYATQLLRDLGADVILIERPDGGDPVRQIPQLFDAVSRGKRSVAIDLKSLAGRQAFLNLAKTADVVIEGFRPGVVDRLGVGPQAVRSVRPNIVYVSISGFGQTGPYRLRPAHDIVFQGVTGLLHDRLAMLDTRPVPVLPIADMAAAMFATVAVLTGLVSRDLHRVSPNVDIAMTEALLSWMSPLLVPAASGLSDPRLPPPYPGYGVYRTRDDALITLGITHEDHLWRQLCDVCRLEHLAQIEAPERLERHEEIDAALRLRIGSRIRSYWDELFTAAEIAYGPVNSLADVPADAQFRARDVFGQSEADGGMFVRSPLRSREFPVLPPGRAPHLGEHNAELLDDDRDGL